MVQHLVNGGKLAAFKTAFNAKFNQGFGAIKPIYNQIAMITKSSTAEEAYGWLGQLPQIREWLGDRHIKSLRGEAFKIENRKFESTISIQRTDFEDDRIGIYAPIFDDLGRRVAEFPDRLLAELIVNGTSSMCYDGQYFFDTDHPIQLDGGTVSASNYQDGAGPAWYLLDLTQAFKPFIYQERMPFDFAALNHQTDETVFMRDEYIYGTRGRCNVGFGLWQLAYASKAELNADNFETVRTAMAKRIGDSGSLLGVRPTALLVPVELEGKARKLLKNMLGEGGASNSWVDSAELIVSPWL